MYNETGTINVSMKIHKIAIAVIFDLVGLLVLSFKFFSFFTQVKLPSALLLRNTWFPEVFLHMALTEIT